MLNNQGGVHNVRKCVSRPWRRAHVSLFTISLKITLAWMWICRIVILFYLWQTRIMSSTCDKFKYQISQYGHIWRMISNKKCQNINVSVVFLVIQKLCSFLLSVQILITSLKTTFRGFLWKMCVFMLKYQLTHTVLSDHQL